jgi:hypothetical protein
MAQDDDVREGLGLLRSLNRFEKIVGSTTIALFITGIVWVTLINRTTAENTSDIIEVKKDQKIDRQRVDDVVLTPTINTEQIKQLQKDVATLSSKQDQIFIRLDKKDSSQIKMLDMLTYIYNKNKK